MTPNRSDGSRHLKTWPPGDRALYGALVVIGDAPDQDCDSALSATVDGYSKKMDWHITSASHDSADGCISLLGRAMQVTLAVLDYDNLIELGASRE